VKRAHKHTAHHQGQEWNTASITTASSHHGDPPDPRDFSGKTCRLSCYFMMI